MGRKGRRTNGKTKINYGPLSNKIKCHNDIAMILRHVLNWKLSCMKFFVRSMMGEITSGSIINYTFLNLIFNGNN